MGKQCGPMCSLERCHQLPQGPRRGGQLQDQVMAVTGSRWDKVRPELGVANGNGCQGLGRQNHGLVRSRGMEEVRDLGLLRRQSWYWEVEEDK